MMSKKYIPKQFSPHLYTEWGELLEGCSTEKKAEYLMAIIKFPNVDIPNDSIWNFMKSQLAKDYYNFVETCKANKQNSMNYWGEKRKANEGERSLPTDIPLLTTANEGEPKQKQLTETLTGTEINTHTQDTAEGQKLYGTFANVCLTTKEYGILQGICLNQSLLDRVIEELSENIGIGKHEEYNSKHPQAHFILLKKYIKNARSNVEPIYSARKKQVAEQPNDGLF